MYWKSDDWGSLVGSAKKIYLYYKHSWNTVLQVVVRLSKGSDTGWDQPLWRLSSLDGGNIHVLFCFKFWLAITLFGFSWLVSVISWFQVRDSSQSIVSVLFSHHFINKWAEKKREIIFFLKLATLTWNDVIKQQIEEWRNTIVKHAAWSQELSHIIFLAFIPAARVLCLCGVR